MPQMSPMKWLYIAFMCYLMFFILLINMNSMPKNLKYLMNNDYKSISWKWYW